MNPNRWFPSLVLAGLSCAVLNCAAFAADLTQRSHILIVGSSTAYPIVTAAAEDIGRAQGFTAPVVESTGTGGGIKLFCSGLGLATPDITMASRSMKDSERTNCTRNHVNDVREIRIGYDGIVFANSKSAPAFELTKRDLYLALAREVPSPSDGGKLIPNPYQTWQQVNPKLPNQRIRVLGPPPTSGTRDILAERLLESVCVETPVLSSLQRTDADAFHQRCQTLREDGAFVNAGENDARIVRKLVNDPEAIGIFGYNFLDRNRDRLQAASIDGVLPEFAQIESGVYALSRPLFIYVKPQHERIVHNLDTFVEALLSPQISGPEGALIEQGLIPLAPAERRQSDQQAGQAAR
ncbi:substrate-binding domain-containing protein [Thiosocius teredinicola]|uniref:substrate-binding domain-containing protein n=1 Tax=Thiosocius teredinicola TaxID=1973002 RepID=UPI000990FDBD